MGRRGGMMFNNLFAFAAATLMGATMIVDTYWTLLIGRFIVGVNAGANVRDLSQNTPFVGINSGLAPIYLTEISPRNYRGAIGSLHQFSIVVAILISQALGLNSLLGNELWWPLLFGALTIDL
jgi:SP family facilitated glucose transporter-like MFS transporter 1